MRSIVIALPLLLIAAPFFARGGEQKHRYVPLQKAEAPKAEASSAEATPAEAAKAGLKAFDFAPLSYYESACARCHGDNGANYGDLLLKHTDAQLHDGIHAMAIGPGQSPLGEEQIAVMVKWHRALLDGKPFVHLMKVERGDKTLLSGEATPTAKVILKSGESSFEATREGAKWKIEAPKDLNLEAAELSAQK